MRSIFKLSLLAASVALVTACGGETETKTETKADAAVAVVETAVAKTEAVKAIEGAPTTDTGKQSYGLGVSFGKYLKRALDENKKVEVILDTEMVMNGVNDAVAGTEKMTPEDIEKVMKELDTLTREKHAELAESKKAEAIQAGKDFMATNAKKEGVKVTESGLQYQVVKAGDGEKPSANDRVKVHYKGTLINGDMFDSSYQRNQPAVFGVSQVIKGWTEGLQLMNVGGKYNFVIPAELAYGERATGKIAAHSTLVFEVELLSIETGEAPKTEAKAGEHKEDGSHSH
jgi:FKBP-type peptidyl-prolyl cis-trans isomerase FkpA